MNRQGIFEILGYGTLTTIGYKNIYPSDLLWHKKKRQNIKVERLCCTNLLTGKGRLILKNNIRNSDFYLELDAVVDSRFLSHEEGSYLLSLVHKSILGNSWFDQEVYI